jgi:predicted transcriptional regulator of viral defense system
MENKKPQLGPLEVQFFAYVQMKKKLLVRMGEFANVLDISGKQERELLSRMARTGLIIRLTRGVYLVPPRVPPGGKYGADEYLLLEKLMEVLKGRYQVSGPNAFNFYGFSDQVPNRVYVYNNRIYGERRIGNLQFSFIKTADNRLGGGSVFKTETKSKAIMASKARTLLDAVYDWSRFNTIPKAYQWIAEAIRKDKAFAEDLIRMAIKYGNQGTNRRLGYLLETLGVTPKLLDKLKRKLRSSKSLFPWVPASPATGSVNRDWGLIINANPKIYSNRHP